MCACVCACARVHAWVCVPVVLSLYAGDSSFEYILVLAHNFCSHPFFGM